MSFAADDVLNSQCDGGEDRSGSPLDSPEPHIKESC